ncbi:MAG: FAD-dependent oxidoreductase, partial [Spirochaetales bacterium]|nr:FAD-dependent oxidoreductase [Spirochaetales bacterium]
MQRMKERFAEKNFELVVVGGGMAGLCAAIEAARDGVKVALINSRPVLGGCASSEIRVHISGADQSLKQPDYAESGLLYELMLENKARNDNFSYSVWDMILFEAATKEPNLTLFMNTVMYDCETEGSKIRSVLCVQETTEMRYRISAPLFVDATGHGTLGYYAGAEYRQGSEAKAETNEIDAPEKANNERLGNTIMFKARDMGHPVPFTPPSFAKKYTEHDLRFRMHSSNQKVDFSGARDAAENERTGGVSSRGSDYGFFWIELSGESDDIITESESIRDELYATLYGVWDHIKNGGDHGAENLALEWVGAFPGCRESRRLVGDYLLDETDILENRIFDDAVAYGGWCVDLHAPHGMKDLDILPSGDCRYFKGVYSIPYRCYYSKNIENLFLAGRDI